MLCMRDAATRNRGFVPAYRLGPGGELLVSDAFVARCADAISCYFGTDPVEVAGFMEGYLAEAEEAGEEVAQALADFLVMAVENDL